jgi:hypothetical protein
MQASGELAADVSEILGESSGTNSIPTVNVSADAPADAPAASTATEAPSSPIPAPPMSTNLHPSATSAANAASDDADVQEYMTRLLSRHAGGTAVPIETPPSNPQPAANSPSLPPVEPITPWNPEDYVPKSVAPEKQKNIKALREVAIQSNRSAIEVSALNQVRAQSTTHKVASLILAVFAIVFLFMVRRPFDVSMCAGILSIIGSGLSLNQARRLRKSSIQNAAPPTPKSR